MTTSAAAGPVQARTTAVKVCGLRRRSDAQACAAAGVAYAGLNRVASSRRCIPLADCIAILDELRSCAAAGLAFVEPVLVYRDSSRAQILSETKRLDVRWVQLHGSEAEDLALLLRASGLQVIRALPGSTPVDVLQAWLACADIVLLDGSDAGSGQPWAWSTPKGLDLQRVWLAGGLTPLNVARALALVPASGVDAASGLESGGALDAAKIHQFVQRAQQSEPSQKE